MQKKILLATGLVFISIFAAGVAGSSLLENFLGNQDKLTNETSLTRPDGKNQSALNNGSWVSEDGSEVIYPYNSSVQPISKPEPDMTQDQVCELVEALPIVISFREKYPDVSPLIFYDGWGYWTIEYYAETSDFTNNQEKLDLNASYSGLVDIYFSNNTYDYLSIIVNDATGTVIHTYQPIQPNLTREDVYTIAVSSTEGKNYLGDHPNAEINIWFDAYQYWYADFFESFDPTISNNTVIKNMGFLSIIIDDQTGEIVEVIKPIEASFTEDQIRTLIENIPEIESLIAKYSDIEALIWYDGFGTWSVTIYSPNNPEVYGYVDISDSSGVIISIKVNKPASYTEEEIVNILYNTQDFIDFKATYNEIALCWYFSSGVWYISFWAYDYPEANGWANISDETGEIIESNFVTPTLPSVTQQQAIDIAMNSELTETFFNKYTNPENHSYFFDGTWIVVFLVNGTYVNGSSEPSFAALTISIDAETGEIVDTDMWSEESKTLVRFD